VTVHGPRSVAEARDAFDQLDHAARRHLGRTLSSYGLLIDDLHVYRAIVSRRPVGLTSPRAGATRALQEVASLLLSDARGTPHGT
jgi:MinD-like ATPase involved in chromosome partitioning or flagellar assembly